MPPITFEQALFHRPDREAPKMVARSGGFDALWIAEAQHLIFGFGDRVHGLRCPLTVFAKPIGAKHVGIVRVVDQMVEMAPKGLQFHFLVVARAAYEGGIRDPFDVAERIAPTWEATGDLPTVTLAEDSFKPRTVAQVQAVLKRIKSAALREGEDPEAPEFERTAENSESPALLGGAQILVDGGRLVFERPEGDLPMVSGLWLLLPEMTRCRIWPTSFAFSQDLDFDVLVVPRVEEVVLESYTTEDQAADYPDGRYEVALQHAAEAGTQKDLDEVFNRRDSNHTLKLAILCLAVVSAIVLISTWIDFTPPSPEPPPIRQAAAAAGIVAIGDPAASFGMVTFWHMLKKDGEKAHGQK